MQFLVLDATTGDVINEFGSGSILSNSDLTNFTIQADPQSITGEPDSVTFSVNGSTSTTNGSPFTLTPASTDPQTAFEPAELSPGMYDIIATFFSGPDGTGQQLGQSTVMVEVVGAIGSGSDGAQLEENQRSEFNVEGETETEAEVEAEAEAEADRTGAAVASAAVASAFGSNAVTQTLASGSVSLDLVGADEAIASDAITSEGPSGAGGRPVGGDQPLSGGDQPADVTIVSAVAEAEAEVESEAEAEAEIGSASATAGLSAAVAAVGTGVFVDETGTPGLVASETATSVTGASATSTSVSDFSGEVDPTQVAPDPADEGTPDAAQGTPAGETNDGPSSEDLQSDEIDGAIVQVDTESEVEIESKAEADVEAEAGTAAAAVSGGTGVAVAGDFASADSETSIGTSTSTSTVTELTPELFGLGMNVPGTLTTNPNGSQASDATRVVFTNGAESAAGMLDPVATTAAGDTTSNVIPGTGLNEAEAEAEAEVEVEVEVENNSAAVATIATGGAGSTAVGATTLVSASTSGVTATSDDSKGLTRANDIVESTTFRSVDDAELTDELARARELNGGIAAEAESEAEATAEVDIEWASPSIGVNADGTGIGNAVSSSGVTAGGILTTRTGEVSTGVSTVAERPEVDDANDRAREAVGAEDQTTVAFPTGNFEVEVEAEAEAEAEVEIGFNSAGAGAGAVAVEARNAFIGLSADATTATSTSVSVRDGGEQVFDDLDMPGPEPLGDTGQIVLPAVDLSGLVFEVEVEAEAEAEVGYNAGAVAAAAGAAGFEGISAEIEMDATTNAAASAAASGAYTDVTITVPEDGMAGFVTAEARAWDPQGRGVAVAVAVAGLSQVGGGENESEIEAEGLFEAVVKVSIYTEAYDPNDISYLYGVGVMEGGATGGDAEPEGPDSVLESEAEVEAEAEAEAGYGVAGAAAATAAAGFAATAVADSKTATGDTGATATDTFGMAMNGTAGNDVLTGTDRVDLIEGGAGNDTLSGGGSGDRILGGAGDDIINGEAGSDALFGNGGDDQITGGAGRDLINGGGGQDTAIYDSGFANLQIFKDLDGVVFVRDLSSGDADQLVGIETIQGTGGSVATSDIGTFNGLAFIASNPDLITRFEDSGLDAPTLTNIAALNFSSAPLGTYQPATFSAENYLAANPDLALRFGNDLVAATLNYINEGASAGRDAGAPAPEMLTDGPTPTDSGEPTTPTEPTEPTTPTEPTEPTNGTAPVREDYAAVIDGTAGDDRLIGTDQGEWIDALDGNDLIRGGGGDDYIIAGPGLDYNISGGAGADIFEVGAGDATVKILDFMDGTDKILLTGGLEFSALDISSWSSNGVTTTNLRGEGGERIILTGISEDQITADVFMLGAPTGGGGMPPAVTFDQELTGTEGRDRLFGSDGADLISGLGGNDLISGGAGDDYIVAGAGNDYNVSGGLGADTFEFNTGDDVLKILDFEQGVDTLALMDGLMIDDFNITSYLNGDGVTTTSLRGTGEDRIILVDVTPEELQQDNLLA